MHSLISYTFQSCRTYYITSRHEFLTVANAQRQKSRISVKYYSIHKISISCSSGIIWDILEVETVVWSIYDKNDQTQNKLQQNKCLCQNMRQYHYNNIQNIGQNGNLHNHIFFVSKTNGFGKNYQKNDQNNTNSFKWNTGMWDTTSIYRCTLLNKSYNSGNGICRIFSNIILYRVEWTGRESERGWG